VRFDHHIHRPAQFQGDKDLGKKPYSFFRVKIDTGSVSIGWE
jgi:hypothetical protein